MPLILGANSVSGYTVKNSLRFNSGSSDHLNRTFGTATNRKIFTLSVWVKRSKLGVAQNIFGNGTGTNTDGFGVIDITSADKFRISGTPDYAVDEYSLLTTQVLRDTSAWYHLIVAFDSTQATSSNRIKMYINGSQVTALDTAIYPSLNLDPKITLNNSHMISRRVNSATDYFDGYMSEYYFIDGQALTPSSFGETDTLSGIWIPKAYTGTYGTNGFNLQFKNSASLGTDSSGNGNTWTVNNLTSIDQTTDTPTNNFATWNPLYAYGNQTITEGNLRLATGTSGASVGTIAVNTGKWFWEQKCISIQEDGRIMGISKLVANESLYNTAIYYAQNGNKIINATATAYGATLADNDIVGLAIDVDAKTIIFYKNGTSQGSIDISSVYSTGDYIIPALPQSGATSQTFDINFGNPSFTIASGNTDGAGYGNFEYAVPSGYYALCTKNLATFG